MKEFKVKHVLNLKDDDYGQICINCTETTNDSEDGVAAQASGQSDETCLDSMLYDKLELQPPIRKDGKMTLKITIFPCAVCQDTGEEYVIIPKKIADRFFEIRYQPESIQ